MTIPYDTPDGTGRRVTMAHVTFVRAAGPPSPSHDREVS